eukprot:2088488-Pleurochrysis_carterae.AAC.1
MRAGSRLPLPLPRLPLEPGTGDGSILRWTQRETADRSVRKGWQHAHARDHGARRVPRAQSMSPATPRQRGAAPRAGLDIP